MPPWPSIGIEKPSFDEPVPWPKPVSSIGSLSSWKKSQPLMSST